MILFSVRILIVYFYESVHRSEGSLIKHLEAFLAPAVFESDIYVIGSLVHDIVRRDE